MSDERVMNRWYVVVGAVMVQLALGAIYAWGVYTPGLTAKPWQLSATYSASVLGIEPSELTALEARLTPMRTEWKKDFTAAAKLADGPEKTAAQAVVKAQETAMLEVVDASLGQETVRALEYGFTSTQAQAVFTVGLVTFALVMVWAGRKLPKFGPRRLAIAGGLALGGGYVLAGLFAGKSFPLMLTFVGIVGGAGIGLAYVVPIAVGMRWFPDKKGMITGLAVAGFGFGAMFWVKLAGAWGRTIAVHGIPWTFILVGVLFLIMVVLGGLVMVNPPEGWVPAGYTPPAPKPGAALPTGSTDFTSGEMLATPQYYMILLCYAFGASAGLMSIGLMKQFPMQALTDSGIAALEASAIAGTAIVVLSLANGLGRIIWGTVSDKLGRKPSIILMMAVQGVVVIAFPKMAGIVAPLYVGAALIGFNFGGCFSLFPAITADTYGTRYVGQNYALVFLAYAIGGIFGPMLGGRLGDMGNYPLAFTICGVLCLVAAVLAALVKAPRKPALQAETVETAPAAEPSKEAVSAGN